MLPTVEGGVSRIQAIVKGCGRWRPIYEYCTAVGQNNYLQPALPKLVNINLRVSHLSTASWAFAVT